MNNEVSRVQSMNVAVRVNSVQTVGGLSFRQLKLGEILHKKLLNSTNSRSIASATSYLHEMASIQDQNSLPSSPIQTFRMGPLQSIELKSTDQLNQTKQSKLNDSIYTVEQSQILLRSEPSA